MSYRDGTIVMLAHLPWSPIRSLRREEWPRDWRGSLPTAAERLAEEIFACRRILLWVGAGNSYSAGIPIDSPDESGLAFRLAADQYGSPDAARAELRGGSRVADLTAKLGKERVRVLILQQGWQDLELRTAHKAIAALIEEGSSIELVTVNLDPLLERGLKAAGIRYEIVCSRNTVATLREGTVAIIKAHGCPYIDPVADNLILLEAELVDPPRWIVNFLTGRLQEKVFVYVGFSGNAPYVQSSISAVVDALGGHAGESYAVDVQESDAVFGGASDLGGFLRLSNVPREKYSEHGSDRFFADTADSLFRRIALQAISEGAMEAGRHVAVDPSSLRTTISSMGYEAVRNFARKFRCALSAEEAPLSLRTANLSRLFKWMLLFVAHGILEDASYRPVLACPYRAGPHSHASAPIVFFDGGSKDAADCADRIRERSRYVDFRTTFQLRGEPRWYAVVLNCVGTRPWVPITIIPREPDTVVGGYSPAVFVDESTLTDSIDSLGECFL